MLLTASLMLCTSVTLVESISTPAQAASWHVPALNTDFPDPSVLQVNGTYYAYSTQVYLDSVPFTTSGDGIHWSAALGDAMPTLPSWATFDTTARWPSTRPDNS